MTSITPRNPWIVRHDSRPGAVFSLVCFAHSGAGASTFRTWPRALPDWVEVVAMELPGRESRFKEPLLTDLNELVNALADEIDALGNRQYALFGHSLGALIAFELTRLLRKRSRPQPVRLFVSGYGAPYMYRPTSRIHMLPETEVIDELRRTHGTPEVVLQSRDLMRVLIPALRADMAMCIRHRYEPDEPLALPISAFGGEDDPDVSRDVLAGWSKLTTSSFRLRMLPGNHFFPATARPLLLAAIRDDLMGHVPPAHGP